MQPTSIKIIKKLKEKGFKAYWAGGCVRDILLNKKPKDLYDNYLAYNTKFILVEKHEEYTAPKKLKHGEVKMVANITNMLSKKFGEDSIISQGRKVKKLN